MIYTVFCMFWQAQCHHFTRVSAVVSTICKGAFPGGRPVRRGAYVSQASTGASKRRSLCLWTTYCIHRLNPQSKAATSNRPFSTLSSRSAAVCQNRPFAQREAVRKKCKGRRAWPKTPRKPRSASEPRWGRTDQQLFETLLAFPIACAFDHGLVLLPRERLQFLLGRKYRNADGGPCAIRSLVSDGSWIVDRCALGIRCALHNAESVSAPSGRINQ